MSRVHLVGAIIAAGVAGYYIGRKINIVKQRQKGIINNNSKDDESVEDTDTHSLVQSYYANAANGSGSSCCGSNNSAPVNAERSEKMGYTTSELELVKEANLGVGCGSPITFANIRKNETVVDLGSGLGIDCLLAAEHVGRGGNVIGVDMTREMIDKARKIIKKKKIKNIEYRLGEIEHLPLANNSVDCVISNCVINLSPEKEKVYKDILRVLKPGSGRIAISDVVKFLPDDLPQHLKTDQALAC